MKTANIVLYSLPVIASAMIYLWIDGGGVPFFGDRHSQGFPQKTAAQQKAEYSGALTRNFDNYDNAYQEESAAFKKEITAQWGEFKTSSSTEWVSYVGDDKVRRSIDYDSGNISVEILVDESSSVKNTKRALEKEIFTLLNTTESEAFNVDRVAKKVEARLSSPSFRLIKRGKPSENRIFSFDTLTSVTFNDSGFIKVSNKTRSIATTDVRPAKVFNKKIVRSSFKVKKALLQKASRYADAIGRSSRIQKIPTALIYAIMESESSFNPMAKSHIPAYGLMQIVPRSAGQDATKHLYGKAKILAPSYLYSTDNNIKVGTAYLHVLYYKYLRKVKDPQSRLYCTIAAYNTGASNVAKAFIDKKHFSKAVNHINKLTPDEVYEALVTKLPFKETRHYMKTVSGKMKKYL